MAETLGSLCDKLIITNLKKSHTNDLEKIDSLGRQIELLKSEIDSYLVDALKGVIPIERLNFAAHKVYNKSKYLIDEPIPRFGEAINELSSINIKLWDTQDKVYNFSDLQPKEKEETIVHLATLNLERNKLIEEINLKLIQQVSLYNQLWPNHE